MKIKDLPFGSPVKKIKMQVSGWEKNFVSHVLGKGLASRIYKELLKLSFQSSKNPLLKKNEQIFDDPLPKKIKKWQISV